MALSGSSSVKLKCGERKGFNPCIVSLLYNLKAFVMSLYLSLKTSLTMVLAIRLMIFFTKG